MGIAMGGRKKIKSEINITPYIDILLVLLIIFMVVAPVRQNGLRAKIPEPFHKTVTVPSTLDAIVLSIGDKAQISINQMPTEIGQLNWRLHEIYGKRPKKDLFLNASPKLPYGDVVKVIDIAKGAGVSEIALLSDEIR
jgi:biopolymer transport protein TolR